MADDIDNARTKGTHCDALLKAATPELYRQNAFRVLGLPVHATLREIERHRKRLEMAAKLGICSSDQKQGGFLSLDQSTDPDSIRQAVECLKDPERRLIDEFFWFWPLKASLTEDKTLGLLSQRNTEEAITIWKEEEKEGCSVSTHNLAVFYHLTALDMEKSLAGKTLAGEELERCQLLWESAFEKWKKLLEDVRFWGLLTERIRSLNDPRLTHETARRIFNSLPKALLLINARLAVRASEVANKSAVERNIQLVKDSGFEEGLLQDVLHEAASPIRERIRILCTPVAGKAKENPEDANQLARSLLSDTKPSLKDIDMLLPKMSWISISLHDEIAEIARNCTIVYGNETAKWDECLSLIQEILPLATSAPLRNRLEDDIKFIQKNLQETKRYERLFGNLKPIDRAPSLRTIYGIGLTVYGSSENDYETHSFLTTYYFVFLAIPVFPICRYRVIPTAQGYRFLGKAPLRTFDKYHLAVSSVVVAIAVLSLIFSSQSEYSNSSSYSNYENNYSPKTQYQQTYGASSLLNEINNGKSKLTEMEAQLEQMGSQLESLSSQINTLKRTIESYEAQVERNQYINRLAYSQAVDNYNDLVNKYNRLFSDSRSRYSEYEHELKRVNEMINEYNRTR